jgi:putative holliday junction resolvase
VSESKTKGKLLGVDFGTVRIGLAITDPDRILASPLATYTRKSEPEDAAYFRKIIAESGAIALVVGLPLHSDGTESDKSREARVFGHWLSELAKLPLVLWDERFTTVRAEDALLLAKLSPKERRERRDRVAAQMMLQDFLNAGCPEQGTEVVEQKEDNRSDEETAR